MTVAVTKAEMRNLISTAKDCGLTICEIQMDIANKKLRLITTPKQDEATSDYDFVDMKK